MRIHICAVGRLRAGPEKILLDDYLTRFGRIGRALGLGPANIIEVEDKKGAGAPTEAALLAKSTPSGSLVCALDERGTVMTSPDFADALAKWRRQDRSAVTFIIGGADGIDPKYRALADASISFGAMVWPHKLVRVMLAEQLYRAASILAGSPYHRS